MPLSKKAGGMLAMTTLKNGEHPIAGR